MNHRRLRNLLEPYLDNELDPTRRTEVEQHLSACEDCRRRLEELKSLNSLLLDRASVEKLESYWEAFSGQFWQELRRRRRAASRPSERPVMTFSFSRIVALAAAALLLVVVGVVGIRTLPRLLEPQSTRLLPSELSARPDTAPLASGRPGRVEQPATVQPKRGSAERKTPGATQLAEPGSATTGQQLTATPPSDELGAGKAAPIGGGSFSEQTGAAAATAGKVPVKKQDQKAGTPTPTRTGAPAEPAQALKEEVGEAVKVQGQKSGAPAPGTPGGTRGPGGVKQTEDTTIYDGDRLSTPPVLVSVPRPSEGLRAKYAGISVRLWIVVERDGSVARAEVRGGASDSDLAAEVVELARRAAFLPGRAGKRTVRSSTYITITIGMAEKKDD